MYSIQQDSAGQKYITVTSKNQELVRITLVPVGWTGGPCLRFQVQSENGRVRQGPEFPVERLGELTLAATKLILRD